MHEYRIGNYYLCRKANSPYWHIGWNDPAKRASGPRRRSLGVADLEAAKVEMARFVTLHGHVANADPAEMSLAQVALRYLEHHAKGLPSYSVARRSLRIWLEHFGEATVGDVTVSRQKAFVADLRRKGHADPDIKRILGTGGAALRWAYRRGEISTVPHVITRSVRDSEPRGRVLEPEEAAAFWHAIDNEHLALYFLLGLNTAGRPHVLRRLTLFQCDFGGGLIDLHPPGAARTAKRNPIVRMTSTIRPWLEGVTGRERVVGHAAKWLGEAWRSARSRAGLDPAVVPYTMRHTVQTAMDEQDVPEREMDDFLGHRRQSRMGEWYTTRRIHRPDYLARAAAAIDHWFAPVETAQSESGRATTRPLIIRKTQALRATSVTSPKLPGPETLEIPGAGEGIRTLDFNLGKVALYP
jgi:integrase